MLNVHELRTLKGDGYPVPPMQEKPPPLRNLLSIIVTIFADCAEIAPLSSDLGE